MPIPNEKLELYGARAGDGEPCLLLPKESELTPKISFEAGVINLRRPAEVEERVKRIPADADR